MKKRRMFDIDLPEDEVDPKTFPAGKVSEDEPAPVTRNAASGRRSPMAAAITENAESLKERRSIEAQIREENDALAAEHVRMKRLGLIVDMVPLDKVLTHKLVRDRAVGDDQELEELKASIRDLGLSNPIRVEAREDGSYELIQGFRRLSAYRALLEETGDAEAYGQIPAGILPRGEDLEGLYRRMVDENLVRKDISFAEMAQLALAYASDPDTGVNDPDKAVAKLFQSAGYQKRSYIRHFIRVMERLGDVLKFAHHLPRALGLKLAEVVDDRPDILQRIRDDLRDWDNRSVTDELEVIRRALGAPVGGGELVADQRLPPAPRPAPGKAKTTFQVPSSLGQAKCTAANGRLEIKLDRDFSALDRRRLEAALARLLNDLA